MSCLFSILGSLSGEHVFAHEKKLRRVLILILSFGLILTWMYQAIIISVLTAGIPMKPIDSLEDLVHAPSVKILIFEGHYTHSLVKNSIFYPQLKDRIQLLRSDRSEEDMKMIYQLVHYGSHVFIEFRSSDDSTRSRFSKDFLCTIPKEDFYYSEAISRVPISFLYRKGLPYAETIDLTILWFEAFGISPDDNAIAHRQWRDGTSAYTTPRVNATCNKFENNNAIKGSGGCSQNPWGKVFPLTQDHLLSLWMVTGALLMASIIVFVVEVLAMRQGRTATTN